MEIIKALILGLTQGLTEFIPVSSSGHLIVVGHLLHFDLSGLTFDIATNIGTLAALLVFFWKDLWQMFLSIFKRNEHSHLTWLVVVATIPAVVLGVLLQSAAETIFRSNVIVAINLIWVAGLMWAADRYFKHTQSLDELTVKQAGGIGVAQALALMPGVSRSGITISAALATGLDRISATRFSFLLSAPIIAGATLKVLVKHQALSEMSAHAGIYGVGIVTSFVGGLIAIRFMLSYLQKHGLKLFVYYRLAVGVLILVLVTTKVL